MKKIGFIGQGFIGKNIADNLEHRGYEVVRYALEEPYNTNKSALSRCQVIFIAIPTPTTPEGFDCSVLETVLSLVPKDAVAVIKSTVLPGTTSRLQAMFPEITLVHNPEFLREKTAAYDASHPERTIIGVPAQTEQHIQAAKELITVLPESQHTIICTAEEAELIKYGGNCFLAMKVVYMNLLHDLAGSLSADYDVIATAMSADSRIGTSHMKVIDQSGHQGAVAGRGAGGHCFPKDLAAFRESYQTNVPEDMTGHAFITSLEKKNNALLINSKKDITLLESIYGADLLRNLEI